MIESSHKRQESYISIEGIKWVGSALMAHLLVRWDEHQIAKSDGTIEYVYQAHRFDYDLPAEVNPGIEAIEYYFELAKPAIIVLAQNLLAQEGGLHEAQ